MAYIQRDEFYRSIEGVNAGITGIHNRLDALNGRTRKVEISTAVQWMCWAILGTALVASAPYVSDALHALSIR